MGTRPSPLLESVAAEAAREAHPLKLSLIVPATDTPSTLEACLDAIHASFDQPSEIIVIDSATGPGAGLARNNGAALATGDILVFVDADVVVHPDAISRLHAHFEANPETAAVFGSYDDKPSAPGTVSSFRNLLHHHVHQTSAGHVGTFWAGLGAVRRDVFEEAGGFDPDRLWLEDVDLGIRLAEAGEEIVLDPAILGKHMKRWTLLGMVKTDFLHRAVPWMELILRHGHASTDLNLGWKHRASALSVLVLIVAAVLERPFAVVAAFAALVALNSAFYRTLRRRQGVVSGLCGIGLHAIHHAVSIAAVPYALAAYAVQRLRKRDSESVTAPAGRQSA
ncbi:MAG: glycosyltransferase [Actinobacteria bacterium]|nr:glycosyltransferase [Actinomycetota bacterium]